MKGGWMCTPLHTPPAYGFGVIDHKQEATIATNSIAGLLAYDCTKESILLASYNHPIET